MTNEERDLIERFIARVGGQPQAQGGFGASVPATQQAALPPIDPEADRFIGDNLTRYPQARYRITQMAVVQEAALAEAQNRIKRLEWELQQAQAQLQQAQSQPQQRSGGLFGGLFGGGASRQAPPQQGYGQQGYPPQQQGYGQQQGYPGGPPPQPAYSPGYQPGMFQRQGSGFLGSALTTAAGVAGGMVAGNALMGMFEGHNGGGGFGGSEGGNAFGDTSSAWGGGGGADPFAGQGTGVDPGFGASDSGGFDSGGGDSGGGDWGGGGGDDNSF